MGECRWVNAVIPREGETSVFSNLLTRDNEVSGVLIATKFYHNLSLTDVYTDLASLHVRRTISILSGGSDVIVCDLDEHPVLRLKIQSELKRWSDHALMAALLSPPPSAGCSIYKRSFLLIVGVEAMSRVLRRSLMSSNKASGLSSKNVATQMSSILEVVGSVLTAGDLLAVGCSVHQEGAVVQMRAKNLLFLKRHWLTLVRCLNQLITHPTTSNATSCLLALEELVSVSKSRKDSDEERSSELSSFDSIPHLVPNTSQAFDGPLPYVAVIYTISLIASHLSQSHDTNYSKTQYLATILAHQVQGLSSKIETASSVTDVSTGLQLLSLLDLSLSHSLSLPAAVAELLDPHFSPQWLGLATPLQYCVLLTLIKHRDLRLSLGQWRRLAVTPVCRALILGVESSFGKAEVLTCTKAYLLKEFGSSYACSSLDSLESILDCIQQKAPDAIVEETLRFLCRLLEATAARNGRRQTLPLCRVLISLQRMTLRLLTKEVLDPYLPQLPQILKFMLEYFAVCIAEYIESPHQMLTIFYELTFKLLETLEGRKSVFVSSPQTSVVRESQERRRTFTQQLKLRAKPSPMEPASIRQVIMTTLVMPALRSLMKLKALYLPSISDVVSCYPRLASSWSHKAQRGAWKKYFRCLESLRQENKEATRAFLSHLDFVFGRISKISVSARPAVTALLSLATLAMRELSTPPPLAFITVCMLDWTWNSKFEHGLDALIQVTDLSLLILSPKSAEGGDLKKSRSFIEAQLVDQLLLIKAHVATSDHPTLLGSDLQRHDAFRAIASCWRKRVPWITYCDATIIPMGTLNPSIDNNPFSEACLIRSLLDQSVDGDTDNVFETVCAAVSRWNASFKTFLSQCSRGSAGDTASWMEGGLRTRLLQSRLESIMTTEGYRLNSQVEEVPLQTLIGWLAIYEALESKMSGTSLCRDRQKLSLARWLFYQRLLDSLDHSRKDVKDTFSAIIAAVTDFWSGLPPPLDIPGGTAWILTVIQVALMQLPACGPELAQALRVPRNHSLAIARGFLEHEFHPWTRRGSMSALHSSTTLKPTIEVLASIVGLVDGLCIDNCSMMGFRSKSMSKLLLLQEVAAVSQRTPTRITQGTLWSQVEDMRLVQLPLVQTVMLAHKSTDLAFERRRSQSAWDQVRLLFRRSEVVSRITILMPPGSQIPLPIFTSQLLLVPCLCRLFQRLRVEAHDFMADGTGHPSIISRWSRLASFAVNTRPLVAKLQAFIQLLSQLSGQFKESRDVVISFLSFLLQGTESFQMLLVTTKDLINGRPLTKRKRAMNSLKNAWNMPWNKHQNPWLKHLLSAISSTSIAESVSEIISAHGGKRICPHKKRLNIEGSIFCLKKSSSIRYNVGVETSLCSLDQQHECHWSHLQPLHTLWLTTLVASLSTDTAGATLVDPSFNYNIGMLFGSTFVVAQSSGIGAVQQSRLWHFIHKTRISTGYSNQLSTVAPIDVLTLPSFGLSWNLKNFYRARKGHRVYNLLTLTLAARSLLDISSDRRWRLFFLPQILVVLQGDSNRLLEHGLLAASNRDSQFLTSLERALGVLMMSEKTTKRSTLDAASESREQLRHTSLVVTASRLRESLIRLLYSSKQPGHATGLNFFENLLDVSANALSVPPESRQHYIKDQVASICKQKHILTSREELAAAEEEPTVIKDPFSGFMTLTGVDVINCKSLKSATKVPYVVPFWLEGYDDVTCNCIFKANDDVRLDELALQMIRAMQSLFLGSGIPLWLRPYGVRPLISRGRQGGIIEMVQNTRSRHEIGVQFKSGLKEYFRRQYTDEELVEAQWNFLRSTAAYSLATFILQVKDRHNANVLVTDQGFTVHIDFGFILGLSPGGDIQFERAPFKLTQDMMQLLNARFGTDSCNPADAEKGFLLLRHLIIEGYLTIHSEKESICDLLKFHQHLPCFKSGTMRYLR
eukprot:Blabericola_migrator_1__6165@NODE_310_length_10075_cov_31_389488_g253_i0_p1_GENE_NODE_310_length_10075_cov_31_389488_g253_i0NODE_310_length_10075_cov_31_389488_g253_i0_p1_ORF_typecomplete_len1926_score202_51PI3_PI4_kinase/PF00454_27/1_8e41_NODE_310_length_10075_cov_31_389488_g253_i027628539